MPLGSAHRMKSKHSHTGASSHQWRSLPDSLAMRGFVTSTRALTKGHWREYRPSQHRSLARAGLGGPKAFDAYLDIRGLFEVVPDQLLHTPLANVTVATEDLDTQICRLRTIVGQPVFTTWVISSESAVHVKGFGSALC
jgi:hypothetical protein